MIPLSSPKGGADPGAVPRPKEDRLRQALSYWHGLARGGAVAHALRDRRPALPPKATRSNAVGHRHRRLRHPHSAARLPPGTAPRRRRGPPCRWSAAKSSGVRSATGLAPLGQGVHQAGAGWRQSGPGPGTGRRRWRRHHSRDLYCPALSRAGGERLGRCDPPAPATERSQRGYRYAESLAVISLSPSGSRTGTIRWRYHPRSQNFERPGKFFRLIDITNEMLHLSG